MKSIQYGVCLPIFACPGPHLFRTAGYASLDVQAPLQVGRLAEELGYDSIWVADHLMLGKDDAILEGWTVLAALAGSTSRVRLGMIHMANYFRNPALTAKMTATLDQISSGRLTHFLDAGYLRREYVNYGLQWQDDLEDRIADLGEATELVLALWDAVAPLTFTGKTYAVHEAVCNPKPLQQPHPPLWFGEAAPGLLDLCAQYGQGWNTTPVSLVELERRLELLAVACRKQGRDIADLELSLETQVLIAPDIATLRDRLAELITLGADTNYLPPEIRPYIHDYANDDSTRAFLAGETDDLAQPMATDWVIGTPDQVRHRLQEYQTAGVTHFMLWFMDAPRTDGMELFAREVASGT